MSRAIAPGFLDNDMFRLQTLQHVMKMTRTWDSTMSMIPKGGDIIWGGLDWSPEEACRLNMKKQNSDYTQLPDEETNKTHVNYGRMISFGRDVAEADSSTIEIVEFRVSIFLTLKLEFDVVLCAYSLFYQNYIIIQFSESLSLTGCN
jgi:phospholipid:diacylglycerol acyltransferase